MIIFLQIASNFWKFPQKLAYNNLGLNLLKIFKVASKCPSNFLTICEKFYRNISTKFFPNNFIQIFDLLWAQSFFLSSVFWDKASRCTKVLRWDTAGSRTKNVAVGPSTRTVNIRILIFFMFSEYFLKISLKCSRNRPKIFENFPHGCFNFSNFSQNFR